MFIINVMCNLLTCKLYREIKYLIIKRSELKYLITSGKEIKRDSMISVNESRIIVLKSKME